MEQTEYLRYAMFGSIGYVTLLIFRILGQFETFKIPTDDVQPMSPGEYHKTSGPYLLMFVGLLILFSGGSYCALKLVAESFYKHAYVGTTGIFPAKEGSLLAGLFLGMTGAGILVDRTLKLKLKADYPSYLRAADLIYRCNSAVLWKWMVRFLVASVFTGYVYALWCVSFIEGSTIHIREFPRIWTILADISEVDRISLSKSSIAPIGSRVYRSNFNIRFKDGYSWRLWDDDEVRHFISELSRKSGHQVYQEEIE